MVNKLIITIIIIIIIILTNRIESSKINNNNPIKEHLLSIYSRLQMLVKVITLALVVETWITQTPIEI